MQPVETQKNANNCRISIGTSGYSYAEWVPAGFYPPGSKSGQMLPLYARHFSITELNTTWYQMPKAEAIERQRRQVPPDFLFAAKLTRGLTHEAHPTKWPENWFDHVRSYRDGLAPLIQAGQLAAVLIQFPSAFDRRLSHRRYLAALLDKLCGLPLAVEFRHFSWANDRVFSELQRRRVTLVAVDEPTLPKLFPALDVVTCPDLFYIRFHGRNSEKWGRGNMQHPFDYDYADDELCEWITKKVEPMASRARRGVIFFNNHVKAQAPRNAQRMIALLKAQGIKVS